MNVAALADVDRYSEARVLVTRDDGTLRFPQLRPATFHGCCGGIAIVGELNDEERQLRRLETLAPVRHPGGHELRVITSVFGIRLALIPDDTAERVRLEWRDHRVVDGRLSAGGLPRCTRRRPHSRRGNGVLPLAVERNHRAVRESEMALTGGARHSTARVGVEGRN